MTETLKEIRDTIGEIITMHQLNYELLEELACKWLLENRINVPNRGNFVSLLNKVDALLNEIHLGQSLSLPYKKLSDGSYHDDESDDKLPEPYAVF